MIDYGILQKSIEYYEVEGFKRIEAPWLVTEAINDITCPPGASKYYVQKDGVTKTFVASGEQSFLYLINKGFLPEGDYQTITPCMRNDSFDSWHTKYFMKNELIRFGGGKLSENDILDLLSYAEQLYIELGCNKDFLETVKTQEGYDITYHGIELGSYGIRKCEFVEWVYGTGIAEPRFSRVLKHKG